MIYEVVPQWALIFTGFALWALSFLHPALCSGMSKTVDSAMVEGSVFDTTRAAPYPE